MLSWLKVTVQVTIRVMVPASWGSVLVYLGSNSILKKERSTNVTVPTSKARYRQSSSILSGLIFVFASFNYPMFNFVSQKK